MEKLALFTNPRKPEACDVCPQLDIKFIGEEAVDQGGVSREFFSCIFEAALQKIMIGNNERNYHTFLHDSIALESGHYYSYGVLVGLALIHGCPGPHNWCPSLAHYILEQDCLVNPSHFPDLTV